MRRLLVVVAPLLVAAACSSGPLGGDDESSACELIEHLGETAAEVEQVDLADPDTFQETLDAAIEEFTLTIDALVAEMPERLHDDLEVMRAAAEQYRFQDAVAARAALDDYAANECGLRAG